MVFIKKSFDPYALRPLCFIDIEGSGTKPGYHEVTEIALDHEKMGRWSTKVKMKHPQRAQAKALEVQQYSELAWSGAPHFDQIADKLLEFLNNSIPVGHFVSTYDLPMIRGNYEMIGKNSDFLPRLTLGTEQLAYEHLVPRGLKRLTLEAICNFLDIDNEGAHRAYDDVDRTRQAYYKMVKTQQGLF